MIRGFNGSIFELRNMYMDVFDNLANEEEELKRARRDYSTKLYKIKYTLNLLTIMESGDDNYDLMGLIGDIEELEVVHTKAVRDLIFFKWNKFGRKFHYFSAMIHILYVMIFIRYIGSKYLYRKENSRETTYILIMCICNTYAMFYDGT
jgi:hypothetical protein